MIRSITSLRAHLQTAIELEHSTIPPYLCALYSIKDATNADAFTTIDEVLGRVSGVAVTTYRAWARTTRPSPPRAWIPSSS